MIGFYNYSVILTYIGLCSSVFGITQAINGHFKIAVVCLMISGLCDMFDGKIARAMKRTEDEQKFGIQIDSLCDLVCFGVFPAILVYSLGARDIFGVIFITLYVLGAVIRLGFFNVMEEKRQKETTEDRKVYQGLPVTSVSILYPIVFLIGRHMMHKSDFFVPFLEGVTLLIAILFVLNIKIKKPNKQASYAMLGFGAIILLKVLGVFKWFR